jgi:hypothetical protein
MTLHCPGAERSPHRVLWIITPLLKAVHRTPNTRWATIQNVPIDHRRLDVRMARQLLNRADVVPAFEQLLGATGSGPSLARRVLTRRLARSVRNPPRRAGGHGPLPRADPVLGAPGSDLSLGAPGSDPSLGATGSAPSELPARDRRQGINAPATDRLISPRPRPFPQKCVRALAAPVAQTSSPAIVLGGDPRIVIRGNGFPPGVPARFGRQMHRNCFLGKPESFREVLK